MCGDGIGYGKEACRDAVIGLSKSPLDWEDGVGQEAEVRVRWFQDDVGSIEVRASSAIGSTSGQTGSLPTSGATRAMLSSS